MEIFNLIKSFVTFKFHRTQDLTYIHARGGESKEGGNIGGVTLVRDRQA